MTAPQRGRVVVLEGLDGCGKSTLAQHLADTLGAVALTTPNASVRAVRDRFDAWGPSPQKWIFYAATVIEVGAEARRLADLGHRVVIDRYWASTLAYALFEAGLAGADDALAGLLPLERWVPPVDETWWLDVDDAERASRLGRRGATEGDRASLAAPDALRGAYDLALRRPINGEVRILEPGADVSELWRAR